MLRSRRSVRERLESTSLAMMFLVASAVSSLASSSAPPPGAHGAARPSAALERMLRDRMEAGLPVPEAVIRRWNLDARDDTPETSGAPAEASAITPLSGVNLAPDVLVNDRSGDATCAACGNRPLGQAETSIAARGPFMVAGWNNTKGFCTGGAIQGYAYSTNGGATWTQGGDPPALPAGGRYRGDPVHDVNPTTGRFYILGLYEGGAPGSGIALCSGRFLGGTFTIDINRQIAVGGTSFLDKPWMAVDPLSGNVYVSWTDFPNAGGDSIKFARLDSLGNSLGPVQFLNSEATVGFVQASQVAVDAGGKVYVMWYEYGAPLSHIRIRRSDSHGALFGPERTVCDFYENSLSGAPGYRRGFGPITPGLTVDRSNGPYHGRVYVTWDESVDFYDTVFSLTSPKSETESNDFFAAATPFTVGDVLYGGLGSTDVDLWQFSGSAGQTVYVLADSVTPGSSMNMRIMCASDTSTFNNYRLLAFDQAQNAALVFTLPSTGTYYLRLNPAAGAPAYRITTAFDVPTPGERARDHRDQFIAYSDDGTTWSTPHLLTDAPARFDGIFPVVTVDGLGRVHVYWHDFRYDPVCGAVSLEYLVSSADGGVTWGPNRALSDVATYWSNNACGSANQGDYQGITSEGANVYPLWADPRLGDPDVYFESSTFSSGRVCPPLTQGKANGDTLIDFTLQNTGNSATTFSWALESDAGGFLVGANPGLTGTVALGPGQTQVVRAQFHGCPDDYLFAVRFITTDLAIPGRPDTCITWFGTCVHSGAVGDGIARLELARPRPNPATGHARFAYSLSRPGPVRLTIFGARGTRIRRLIDGTHEAGPAEVVWDGRDDQGRRVAPGVYYARLEAEGVSLHRTVSLMR